MQRKRAFKSSIHCKPSELRQPSDGHGHGLRIGRYKVASIDAPGGLEASLEAQIFDTTDSKHDLPIAANVLNRQFNPTAPNVAYVSDISYIRTGSGWLYLATVLDLYARKVVG